MNTVAGLDYWSVRWRSEPVDRADRHGAGLELRHPRDGVQYGVGQRIGGGLPTPVKGHEDRVGADIFGEPGAQYGAATAGVQSHEVAWTDADPAGEFRMQFDEGVGLGSDQRAHPPGLRPGLVM